MNAGIAAANAAAVDAATSVGVVDVLPLPAVVDAAVTEEAVNAGDAAGMIGDFTAGVGVPLEPVNGIIVHPAHDVPHDVTMEQVAHMQMVNEVVPIQMHVVAVSKMMPVEPLPHTHNPDHEPLPVHPYKHAVQHTVQHTVQVQPGQEMMVEEIPDVNVNAEIPVDLSVEGQSHQHEEVPNIPDGTMDVAV